MLDKFFCWFCVFSIDGVLCFLKSSLVGKVNRICQPISISCHLHRNVHNGTTNSYLYFLNLIEKKHTQFLVEAIEIQHLLESCTIFILMSFLWNFQEWVHISGKTIVPDALQISYRFGFIGNNKPTTFQQNHQVCLCHIMFHEVR